MRRNRGLIVVFAISCLTSSTAQISSKTARSVQFDSCTVCLALVLARDTSQFVSWTKARNVKVIQRPGPFLFKVSAPASILKDIRSNPAVEYVDKGDRRPRPETILGRFDITANGVRASKALNPGVDGRGTMISIKEKPFFKDDIDLKGRVKSNSQVADSIGTLHASMMATIAAGGGNSSSYAEGVATAAQVTSSDFDNLLPDDGNTLLQLGVTVQNHSYGVGIENYYGIESHQYDVSAFDYPSILHVFSSGNEGDQPAGEGRYEDLPGFANLTGQFKVAKNVLTVGTVDRLNNIAPRSSRGPAHDGRVKPEVVAYGDAGSSESAALVAGAASLIQQAFYELHGKLPDAGLVKAVLINSADDVGRPGIDFETGFGNINVRKAVATVKEGRFIHGDVPGNASNVWPLDVPSGLDLVKVTIVWPDPPAEPFNEHALVNNLDIELHTPGGEIIQPWILNSNPSVQELTQEAVRGRDTLNNVEEISLMAPAAGAYSIVVRANDLIGANQKYFIALHYGKDFEWHHPVSGSFLLPDPFNVLRWSTDSNESGILHYRMSGDASWTMLGNVYLPARTFVWSAADLTGNVQFRMTIGAREFISGFAPLSRSSDLSVGFNCEDELMISWPRDPSASAYGLYQLGEKYLEPLVTSVDTFAILNKASLASPFLAVINIYNGLKGSHESTIDYTTQAVGCYFITVLPRVDIESEKAIIDIELGTTYKLSSAELEWKRESGWEVVEKQEPLLSEVFSMTHEKPLFDENIYRVKLSTIDGQQIFSDEISILVAGENSLYVYPNPVDRDTDISVIVNSEEPMLMHLINSNGQLARTTGDFGTIKAINTSGLSSGIYFLQAVKPNGNILTCKIMIR
jgi:hypothetical protein